MMGRMRARLGLVFLAVAVAPAWAFAQADWARVGNDPGAMRHSSLRQIHRGNVSRLRVAWIYRTGGQSEQDKFPMQCTPIVVDGVMYLTGPNLTLFALDAATGRERWRFDPKREAKRTYLGNRGVAYWSDGRNRGARRVLLATTDGRLYSLDAATGVLDPAFGQQGCVDLREGMGSAAAADAYGMTAAPVVWNHLVILGMSMSDGAHVKTAGDVRAFDVRTGREAWRFHTVPPPGEAGHETWEGDSWKERGGVNAWGGATIDVSRGLVFASTGSAAFDFHGADRPGDNLYANSVLCLDARTGKRVWHFQTVHHDVWDYDLPAPPTLVTLTRRGRRVEAAAQVTKMGFVYLLDRTTGKPLFEVVEKTVPASDVPGEVLSRTQPFPLRPPPLARQGWSDADVTDISPQARDHVLGRIKGARMGPLFTPISREGTVFSPGTLGGMNWSGASFDPATGWLYMNSQNLPMLMQLVPAPPGQTAPWALLDYTRLFDQDGYPGGKPPWGLLSAVDLGAGEVRWQVTLGEHEELTARGIPPTGTLNMGGSIVTAGGLVFIGATKDERFRAFDSATGKMLWQARLPYGGYATPATYSVNGRQFVVIAAGGGGKLATPPGDAVVAFALP
jgi:quinoprotein glucose dehydrogenase